MPLSNTLTGLIPVIYRAMQVTSREPLFALRGATIDARAEQAGLDQPVRAYIAPAATTETITPSMAISDTGGQTMTYVDMTISKVKRVRVPFSGEEIKSVGQAGYEEITRLRFEQAIRALVNEMEADAVTELYTNASRAVGDASADPFASNFNYVADANKILQDNGAPGANDPSYRTMVTSTTYGASLRKLSALYTVANAGTDATLRNGIIPPLLGYTVGESAQISQHVKGAGTGYDVASGGEAVGQTTLSLEGGTVNSTGIKAGDIVTFSGGTTDTNKYVVNTGLTSTSGDIVIGNPGLKVVKVDADEMTIGNSYTPTILFSRNALAFAARLPAVPNGRDQAVDSIEMRDPITGIMFSIRHYLGDHAEMYSVEAAWGKKVTQSEHVALILGL
mgnify:CR=1 FL=1